MHKVIETKFSNNQTVNQCPNFVTNFPQELIYDWLCNQKHWGNQNSCSRLNKPQNFAVNLPINTVWKKNLPQFNFSAFLVSHSTAVLPAQPSKIYILYSSLPQRAIFCQIFCGFGIKSLSSRFIAPDIYQYCSSSSTARGIPDMVPVLGWVFLLLFLLPFFLFGGKVVLFSPRLVGGFEDY